MKDQRVHKDWLPIGLPNDIGMLKLMLWWERHQHTGSEMIEPIERKIAKLEKEKVKHDSQTLL